MQIGKLSRRCGVSVRMLRYYEKQGLLHPVRKASGYRDFSEADVGTIQRIVMLNAAGLTLKTIRQILPCARAGSMSFHPCAEFKSSLHRKLDDLDSQIAILTNSRHLLATYLKAAE